MSNELWNIHATANPNAECSDFETVTEWAADYIVHLETELAKLRAVVGNGVALINSGRCGLGHDVLITGKLNNE